MNTIYAKDLFSNENILNNLNFSDNEKITLDFSHINDFNLNDLYALLNLQKLALFNNTKLQIKNTTPNVDKVLFETGIYKTFSGFNTNPILATKRLSFS